MVKALRAVSKNIMYTVVHSGNYTVEPCPIGMDTLQRVLVESQSIRVKLSGEK